MMPGEVPKSVEGMAGKGRLDTSMVHIEVPLRMKGGISIRRYAAKERRAGLCASDKTGASDR